MAQDEKKSIGQESEKTSADVCSRCLETKQESSEQSAPIYGKSLCLECWGPSEQEQAEYKVFLEREKGNLNGANLKGVNLSGADLSDANLKEAILAGTNLQDAFLKQANLKDADLSDANLKSAQLTEANLPDANLRGASLNQSELWSANLKGASLQNADLAGAHLRRANLQGANLRQANAADADLWGANLRGALLQNANLQNAGLLRADLCEADLRDADFTGANLFKADLKEAYFWEAKLEGANMREVDLTGASLTGANLSGADLGKAILSNVDLERANLREAELSYADLSNADLLSADVRGARFIGANVSGSNLIDLNMEHYTLWTIVRDMVRFTSKKPRVEITRWDGVVGLDSAMTDDLTKRYIRDISYIETFRAKHPQWAFIWRWTCNYGQSFLLWAGLCLVVAMAFGSFYAHTDIVTLAGGNKALDAAQGAGRAPTALTPYYFSIVTFTTLGFGDVTPNNFWGELCVLIEVLLGYIALGGLMSILANKVARRS